MKIANEIRLSLSLEDFEKLVAGQVVTKDWGIVEVQLALQDIGFEAMGNAILKATR